MQRTKSGTSYQVRSTLLGLVLATLYGAETLAAQHLNGGRVSTTVRSSVGVVIPARVLVSAVGPPTVVSSSPEYLELELHLRVAANVSWTLDLVTGAALIEVRNGNGAWITAEAGTPVALVESAQPTNQRSIAVRLRLRGTAASRRSASAEFVIAPAAPTLVPTLAPTDARTASVAWTAGT